jgi:hypothetical protein
VTEIAGASREQSSGIEQVTQAVAQMDEVTQQNAALVEEAAAAAESLEDQAKALAKAVAVFNIGSGQNERTAANVLRRTHMDFEEITHRPQAAGSRSAQRGRR